jgi:hypothetical protein
MVEQAFFQSGSSTLGQWKSVMPGSVPAFDEVRLEQQVG